MSFNRRGPDRRPDRPFDRDRPPRPRPAGQGGGDWQRDRPRNDRERPFTPRPRFDRDRTADEGGMSLRLDPRRLQTLKQLAAEADTRPGDLVRQWVEERIDAMRSGAAPIAAGAGAATGTGAVLPLLRALEARVAALEAAATGHAAPAPTAELPADEAPAESSEPVTADEPEAVTGDETADAPSAPRARRNAVSAAPSGERVALHDEMIAVLRERGPMTARELAGAIAERGRYAPPRSGKTLDAAMVSQRVSNPTYRSRFTRNEGRIGLTE
jgi:hypothetical protein